MSRKVALHRFPNQLVYELYGMTEEEIKIIEKDESKR